MSPHAARTCPACDTGKSRPLGAVAGFDLLSCRACGTLFTARLPGPAEGTDYGGYYHAGNLEVPAFIGGRLAELVASFERYRRLGRWLDVGSGAGTLLEAAANAGWDVVGTEVAAGAAEAVRARGFDVRTGELGQLGLVDASFDVVSMVEVLEHVPDPRDLVRGAARLLRAGGALYVTTPHGRGVSRRLLGMRWSVIAPPEHLQLFSVTGLGELVGDAGLTVTRARTQAVNPSELLNALRRGRPAPAGGSRVDSAYRLNESLSSNRAGSLAKGTVNALLGLTRLGDSIRLVAERPS